MKPVLILKMGPTIPHLSRRRGEFDDWIAAPFKDRAITVQSVSPYTGETLPQARACAGVVISGSHAYVTDRETWSENVAAWIPGVLAAKVPLLGICYGHQLLAMALGGTVGDSPVGIEMGTVAVKTTKFAREDFLFRGLTETFEAQVSHSQSVLTLPPDAVLLAHNRSEPHHAFAIGPTAWGLQFHPEFDADIMRTYVTEFAPQLISHGHDPRLIRRAIAETPISRQILARFAQLVSRLKRD